MAVERAPSTRAVQVLRRAGAEYTEHLFDYERYPGAQGAAEYLGVHPRLTAKTIVLTSEAGKGVIALMHGHLEVSVKKLARELDIKSVRPADQREAARFTGYQFGGTSPLGLRTDLPVYAQEGLAELDIVYVNGGSRGFLVGIDPGTLLELTGALLADIAVD